MNRPLRAHIFDRADDEYYVEPRWVSDALFAVEGFQAGIWDPACGRGNILAAAVVAGARRVVGSDIIQRGTKPVAFWSAKDFFDFNELLEENIVTNPPFGRAILAEKFIRHALSLKPLKLAVFVDSRFLFGKARAAGLFTEFPPSRIWLITPRPSCPPGAYLEAGNKASGGTADYCWVVWDEETRPRERRIPSGVTSIGWLRCAT